MQTPLQTMAESKSLEIIFPSFFLLAVVVISNGAFPCVPRDFGQGSIVCVCNASYCDTVPPPRKVPNGYSLYTSSKAGLRLTRTEHVFNNAANSTNGLKITVNRTQLYQSIIGFGGAFTDAAGVNIRSLPQAAASRLLRSYYSPDGIEYNLGRIPMASCDFSTHVYSYDDWPGDFDLSNFSLATEDLTLKIPIIKEAQKLSSRQMRLFASPWGPPYWMKTNHNMSGMGTLIGKPGGKFYKTWAKYFVRFLEEYAKNNVTLWGLTAENEPKEGMTENYPFQCLGFTAELQRDFIAQDLGPALEAAGFGDVKLMIIDDQRLSLLSWSKVILGYEPAARYVSGIAVHWYADKYLPASLLSLTHDTHPDFFILGTEACEGGVQSTKPRRPVILGSWDRFESYSNDILDDLNNWVTGWTDWNIALDLEGGPNWVSNFVDSPIIVNSEKKEFYKQPMFYALGHFSKFLPHGSVRIGLTMDDNAKLKITAFLTPEKKVVLIVLNTGESEEEFHVFDDEAGVINAVTPPRSLLTIIW